MVCKSKGSLKDFNKGKDRITGSQAKLSKGIIEKKSCRPLRGMGKDPRVER